MKSLSIRIVFALTMVLCCALSAQASFSIIDLNTTDANTITGFGENASGYWVTENYGERYLTTYHSHDGNAVINQQGEFFNKKVTLDSIGQIVLNFSVLNATPYTWSDYHFIVDQSKASLVSWTNTVFTNAQLQNNELSFWAPGWVAPGQTASFTLTLDAKSTEFEISQIATTTPIPAAAWLLGSGLLGLAGIRRKNG